MTVEEAKAKLESALATHGIDRFMPNGHGHVTNAIEALIDAKIEVALKRPEPTVG